MKLGLVLSGGGIRGVVHIGVLKALEENNVKIDVITGTSSGSLVSSLYALGYSPMYIYQLFKRYAKFITNIEAKSILNGAYGYITSKKINFAGIKDGKKIEDLYNYFAIKKNVTKMSDIKMPIAIPTVDIQEGKEYVFTNNNSNNRKNKYITDISVRKSSKSK